MKDIITIFFGLSGGMLVAGGTFAFLIIVGVITRLIAATQTQKHITLYEDIAVIAITVGNIMYLYEPAHHISPLFYMIPFFLVGIFTGCLAAALAETVNVLPIIARRFKMSKCTRQLIISFALGKLVGSLLVLLNS